MDSSALKFLFFTLSSIILFSHSPLAANADLISDICKNTIDNSGCLALLKADPRASSAKNDKELAKAVLGLAVSKATESQNFIKEVLKKKEDPSIKRCATFSYDGVVGSFKSALNELEEDAQTANYDSKVAGDNARDCQTELDSHGIQNPDIAARNKAMILLSSIAFEVTNNIL